MVLWLAIALMTSMAIIILALPLIRKRYDNESSEEKNIAIYKDQLRELDSDLKRGLIGSDDYDAAKVEIQRRILAVEKDLKQPEINNQRPFLSVILSTFHWIPFLNCNRLIPVSYARWITVSVFLIFIPALSISIYMNTGNPGLQAEPFAERNFEQKKQELAGQDIELAITNLEEKLLKNPNNLEGWLMLGRTYMTLERYLKAVDILREASVIFSNNQLVMTMLGEAIVLSTNGQITVESKTIFETVLSNDPTNPAARYYLALALAQGGRTAQALEMWMDLAADTPENTPWRMNLVTAINKAAVELETEIYEIPYATSNIVTGAGDIPITGPTAEDVAAASEMNQEDRQAMITGMVENLAQKLVENPNDLSGWKRLIRAYRVLGHNDKAEQAEIRLAEIQSQNISNKSPSIEAISKDKISGPTESQIADAKNMTSQERRDMILSMVEGLADRLKDTPEDLEGWIRLAKSWKVLKEHQKSVDAYERVVILSPGNASLQAEYGRALMDANSNKNIIPEEAIVAFNAALELDPDHPEALWFSGYAAAMLGNYKKAREQWKHLLGLLPIGSPDYQAVKQAMESL
ncbi:MAG: c-type cytochrome biogenesis protein CcmI [Alphaproteobacteria bacterium]|nr:c-type cytochrome biogenesis protein CcmI [Alphaproteobacteria bacterium]|tara:strand:- start:470 stop:2209 length:1740 start_codon:yes stop_codon:yes gene_type:complete